MQARKNERKKTEIERKKDLHASTENPTDTKKAKQKQKQNGNVHPQVFAIIQLLGRFSKKRPPPSRLTNKLSEGGRGVEKLCRYT